jgi:hypothetical protein
MSHPHNALAKALVSKLGAGPATISNSGCFPWASVTFSGARHHFSLEIAAPDAVSDIQKFVAGIAAENFELIGHLVADIIVTRSDYSATSARVDIEALTVETG